MNKNLVNVQFTATETDLVNKIDAINRKLDNLIDDFGNKMDDLGKKGKAASDGIDNDIFVQMANALANVAQTADLVIQRLGQLIQQTVEFAERGASFNLLSDGFENTAQILGSTGDDIIATLKEVSSNAISERDIILATNRAQILKVAQDTDSLTDLLEVAIARAQKLGVSSTQAFNDIVTGIGRESPLILDNLGIVISLEDATNSFAESLGKTADELDTYERKQAIVNAVIAESTQYLDQAKTQAQIQAEEVAKLKSSWQDFGDTLAASVAPNLAMALGLSGDLLQKFTDDLKNISNPSQIEQLRYNLQSLQELSGSDVQITPKDKGFFDTGVLADAAQLLKDYNQEAMSLSETIEFLDQKFIKSEKSSSELNNALFTQVQSAREAAEQTQKNVEYQEQLAQKSERLAAATALAETGIYSLASASAYAANELGILENQLTSLDRANQQFAGSVSSITNKIITSAVNAQKIVGTEAAKDLATNALDKLNISANETRLLLEEGNASALDLALTFGVIEDDLLSPFVSLEEQQRLAQAAVKQTASEATRAADLAARESEKILSDLRSKVSSVLSEALDPGVGVNPDDILPRTDAINEDARRLADVAVKGFESPWYDYFKDKFPALFQQFFSGASTEEGVKLQAARLLKNFQDGLVPELIDKETAKERVRTALIGEQNLSELANEIAQELAEEFGTNLSSVQSVANRVLGNSDQSLSLPLFQPDTSNIQSSTDAYQEAFVSSFDGFSETFATLLGNTFSAKVIIEAATTGGRQNGEVWGTGFFETVGESVPSGLVDLLTLKVLPNVENALNQSSNQESAR